MGQRSQIYLKYPIGDKGKFGLIANYYGWNYGERMISRAAYAIRYLTCMYCPEYGFMNEDQVEKMRRYLDVNFDMNDIVMSTDLIREYEDSNSSSGCLDYVFNQANNDGRLFLDCVLRKEHDRTVCEIRYCFTDCEYNILDAEQYMEWQSESLTEHWRRLLPESAIVTCDQNMEYIMENAVLMDEDELYEMMHFPYENIRNKNNFGEIRRFRLKENITADDIRKAVGLREGGSWIQEDCKQFLCVNLVDSMELNIGFPDDLSQWNDWDHILVLDDDFCQPYTPFYTYWNDVKENGRATRTYPDFLRNVIDRYNEEMGKLEFLEEAA